MTWNRTRDRGPIRREGERLDRAELVADVERGFHREREEQMLATIGRWR